MRRENDVREVPQWMLRRQRILIMRVQRRTAEMTVPQHGEQRFLLNERTTRGIEHEGSFGQCAQFRLADDALRLGGQWHGEDEEVQAAEKCRAVLFSEVLIRQ